MSAWLSAWFAADANVPVRHEVARASIGGPFALHVAGHEYHTPNSQCGGNGQGVVPVAHMLLAHRAVSAICHIRSATTLLPPTLRQRSNVLLVLNLQCVPRAFEREAGDCLLDQPLLELCDFASAEKRIHRLHERKASGGPHRPTVGHQHQNETAFGTHAWDLEPGHGWEVPSGHGWDVPKLEPHEGQRNAMRRAMLRISVIALACAQLAPRQFVASTSPLPRLVCVSEDGSWLSRCRRCPNPQTPPSPHLCPVTLSE